MLELLPVKAGQHLRNTGIWSAFCYTPQRKAPCAITCSIVLNMTATVKTESEHLHKELKAFKYHVKSWMDFKQWSDDPQCKELAAGNRAGIMQQKNNRVWVLMTIWIPWWLEGWILEPVGTWLTASYLHRTEMLQDRDPRVFCLH